MLMTMDFLCNESKTPAIVKALLGLNTESITQALFQVFVCGWPTDDAPELVKLRRKYLDYLWAAQIKLHNDIVRVNSVTKELSFHSVDHIRPWNFSLMNMNDPNADALHDNLQRRLKILKQKTHLDKFTRGSVLKVKVIVMNQKYCAFDLSSRYRPRKLRRALESPDLKIVICTGIKTYPLYNVKDNFHFPVPQETNTFVITCEDELSLHQVLMIYAFISGKRKQYKSQLKIPCFSAFRIDVNSMKMFNELDEFPGWEEK